ncbi:hypothetical protein FACS1894141_0530 [Spirochaetia bacterium]|nr:hypothetical protein FACS1894141_0530 [Spirochaetia bacterium]
MNLETESPRIGNRSDAVDLISTLIELIKDDTSKKGWQLWCGLKTLRDAIERGII